MSLDMYVILGAFIILMLVNFYMTKKMKKKWPDTSAKVLFGMFILLAVLFISSSAASSTESRISQADAYGRCATPYPWHEGKSASRV